MTDTKFDEIAAFLSTPEGRAFAENWMAKHPIAPRPTRPRPSQFDFKCSGKKGEIVEVSRQFDHPHRGEKIFAVDSLDKPFVNPPGVWEVIEREHPHDTPAAKEAWKIFRAAQRAYDERSSATSMQVVLDGESLAWKRWTKDWTAAAQALGGGISFNIKSEMKFIVEFAEDCDWTAMVLARPLLR